MTEEVTEDNTKDDAEQVEDLRQKQATETMEAIFQRNADSSKVIILDDAGSSFKPPALNVVPGRPLTDQMKRDNWQLYVLARSNDPTVMVPNTRKLISNLVQSAKRMKNWSRNPDLVFAIKTSQEAWYEYSEEKNWGIAVQLCETVIDRIGDLLYETEWAMGQSGSFAGPGVKK